MAYMIQNANHMDALWSYPAMIPFEKSFQDHPLPWLSVNALISLGPITISKCA
ncbi:hypothetical protein C5167_050979 [Papaver somniferum]|uniref:Uncharacterized protein n=1 Tax=Papaver somniferum TaxID=3469 RepID=A0A4Y7KTP6_PAPSO|nr:hypothetical protein C5167_050979 [Papaver somniferum]